MAVVTLKEILESAKVGRYGVGMFDVQNLEMTNAVIEAAEEEQAPVILALAEVHAVNPDVLTDIGTMVMTAAQRAKVPVAVHFDHGISKINIYTEVVNAALNRSESFPGTYAGWLDMTKENMKRVVGEKIRIFGSAGRA